MAENDQMWHEERGTQESNNKLQGSDLRNVGVTPGAINTDLDTLGDIEANPDMGPDGGPMPGQEGPQGEVGAGGVAGTMPGAGGGGGAGSAAGAGAI